MKKTYLAVDEGVRALGARCRCLLIPVLLLGLCSLPAQAQIRQTGERISLEMQQVPVIRVFQSIQQQTGYSFVYNTTDVNTQRNVSLTVRDEKLSTVLDKLFVGTDVAYTLRDKHIVLSKRGATNTPPMQKQV